MPCSVYLTHSKSTNLSVYIITASRHDDWIGTIKERLGVEPVPELPTNLDLLVNGPFALHAIISGIAFEQSIEYVTSVREKLMGQVGLDIRPCVSPQMSVH